MLKQLVLISSVIGLSLAAQASVASMNNCGSTSQSQIINSETQVAERLNELLSLWPQFDLPQVVSQFVLPQSRVYSTSSSMNKNYEDYWLAMQENFLRMQASSHAGINFECTDSNSDPNCGGGDAFAYVKFFGNTPVQRIYVCSNLFGLTPELQTSIIFHELSHYAAATMDDAMDWWTPTSIDLQRAAQDAYHVQNFTTGDVGQFLKNSIWVWVWPKATQNSSLFY